MPVRRRIWEAPFQTAQGDPPPERFDLAENTWWQKLKRALTGFLPIAKTREGQCHQCGACCQLMVRCPFLRYDPRTSKARCRIYVLRPPACRKYPRVAEEQVCLPCGYRFRSRIPVPTASYMGKRNKENRLPAAASHATAVAEGSLPGRR